LGSDASRLNSRDHMNDAYFEKTSTPSEINL
jgi:hypothetical protein